MNTSANPESKAALSTMLLALLIDDPLVGAFLHHNVQDLVVIFDDLFGLCERTCLAHGGAEPSYSPATQPGEKHRILYAHGFYASALHEIAHWCIAGRERRLLLDYGYWYEPDGRSPQQQQVFAQVEAKPQALEWIFAVAAGSPFHFSADNLAAGGAETTPDWLAFQQAVVAQVHRYLQDGLPPRAARFAAYLSRHYGTEDRWRCPASYLLDAAASS